MEDKNKSLSIWDRKSAEQLSNTNELQDVTFLHIRKASELNVDFSLFPSLRELWIDSKQSYRIPDSLLELKELNKLLLDKNCILPADIHLMKSLRDLRLEEEGILNPPYTIRQLQSLKELHILGGLEVDPSPVPEWIFEMKQVEKIRFGVCRFSKIDEKINQLKNLVDLDFGCSLSDLESFPDLSGLTKLKRLCASGEAVQKQKLPSYSLFPQVLESIRTLNNLEYLDLSFWRPKKKTEWLVVDNKRHSIPDIFDRYPDLQTLSLCGMKLDFIPPSILGLKNLKYLNILENKLDNDEVSKVIHRLPNCRIDSDIVNYKPKQR